MTVALIYCGLLTYLVGYSCGKEPRFAWKEAVEDLDLGTTPHHGQNSFPELWKRELMAETALSRLLGAGMLTTEPWSALELDPRAYFRATGLYEMLLNMVRITDFQMYNQSWPNAWSMWGVQASLPIVRDEARYRDRRELAQDYPFKLKPDTSRLEQVTMAFVMASKWAVDLRGKVTFYDKPFYSISESVEALIKLRDPTSYFKGSQEEGERILRSRLIDTAPPVCSRQLRIAIAFDTFSYIQPDMDGLNQLLNSFRQLGASNYVSIRGTSELLGGFMEGERLTRVPNIRSSETTHFYHTWNLIERCIMDIVDSEEGLRTVRARALIIISNFLDHKADAQKASRLWTRMQSHSIQPFYVSVGLVRRPTKSQEASDLIHLINSEVWRGVVIDAYDSETIRLVSRRMGRLICQAATNVSDGMRRQFQIDSRLLLYHKAASPGTLHLRFRCPSRNDCQIDFYTHSQRYVSELYHNYHAGDIVPWFHTRQWDFFTVTDVNYVLIVSKNSCVGEVEIF